MKLVLIVSGKNNEIDEALVVVEDDFDQKELLSNSAIPMPHVEAVIELDEFSRDLNKLSTNREYIG